MKHSRARSSRRAAAIFTCAVLAAGLTAESGWSQSAKSLGVIAGPPRELRIPDRQTAKLANGMLVHWLENNELPLVTGTLMLNFGSAQDPPEKTGLTAVAMRALTASGTKALPGEIFTGRLEALGAKVEAETELTRSVLRFRCLREDFDEVSGMFAGLVTDPMLDEDALDITLGQFRGAVAARNNDLSAAVLREAKRLAYGPKTPMGTRIEYGTLDNIGAVDVRRLYGTRLKPGAAALSIFGANLDDGARARVEKLFGEWSGAAEEPVSLEGMKIEPAVGVHHMDERGLRRGLFAMAGQGGQMGDSDLPAMLVAAELIGGSRGLLAEVAAKNRLWALGVAVEWGSEYDRPGLFTVNASVDPAFVAEAIGAVGGALEQLKKEAAPEAEVEGAKIRLLSGLATRFAAPDVLTAQMLASERYGAPASHVAAVWNGIRRVTPAQVRDAMARRVDSKNLVVVTVGPETLYGQPLSSLGREAFPLDMAIPEPKPMTAPADPASIERGKAMLERMAAAFGGADRLRAAKELELRLKARTRFGTSAWTDVTGWERWMAEEKYRQETVAGSLKTVTYYDGSIGWQSSNGRLYAMTPALLHRVRGEIFRYFHRLALSSEDPKRIVNHLGANIVQVTNGEGEGVRIYVDEETNLPSRLTYRALAENGASIAVEESLSAWSEHEGIQWPGKVTVKENGRRAQEIEYESIRFTPGLNAAAMASKP